MKKEYEYTVSIDIDSVIVATSDKEALEQAKEQLYQGCYSILIVDKQEL